MGKFIWHQWARFVNIFASVCAFLSTVSFVAVLCADSLRPPPLCLCLLAVVVWAGFWGCLYPKFFWDFVRGSLLTADVAKSLGQTCTDLTPCGIV